MTAARRRVTSGTADAPRPDPAANDGEGPARAGVTWLPHRRPADPAFLALVRGAHLELSDHARPRSPYHEGAASHAIVATVAVFLVVASAGTAAALSATSEPPAKPIPACAPIHYVVNLQGSPDGALDVVHESFRRLADASGRPAEFDGFTTEEPSPPWLPKTDARRVLVAWIDADRLEAWSGRPDSLGFTASDLDNATGAVASATISLNGDTQLRADFAARRSWGGVLLHELGHVVGLGHSVNRADAMFAELHDGAAEWSTTDRMRLAAVGARAGC